LTQWYQEFQYDSTWEAAEAFTLDQHRAVDAWVKHDHFGFEVLYVYRGVVRKYRVRPKALTI